MDSFASAWTQLLRGVPDPQDVALLAELQSRPDLVSVVSGVPGEGAGHVVTVRRVLTIGGVGYPSESEFKVVFRGGLWRMLPIGAA